MFIHKYISILLTLYPSQISVHTLPRQMDHLITSKLVSSLNALFYHHQVGVFYFEKRISPLGHVVLLQLCSLRFCSKTRHKFIILSASLFVISSYSRLFNMKNKRLACHLEFIPTLLIFKARPTKKTWGKTSRRQS